MVVAASLELSFKMGRKFPCMKNFKQRLPQRAKRLCRILPLLVSMQVSAQMAEPFDNPSELDPALIPLITLLFSRYMMICKTAIIKKPK